MSHQIKQFITQNQDLLLTTLKELCEIPAPSHGEQKRAEYCRDWLWKHGATTAYIDEALNVVYEHYCESETPVTLFCAHTDTVFPDTQPMPYVDDGQKIHCPGVADDTASVAVLLLTVKYYLEHPHTASAVLFVFNSCEEGLGNLKGIRHIFKTHGDRIGQAVSFDSELGVINDCCVGSHRYRVEVTTEGGHSFEEFGKTNAIAVLSNIVSDLYKIPVLQKDGIRTTYNVGTMEGGTSVNTIAQTASMLCEYRSNDADCMEQMRESFFKVFDKWNSHDAAVTVTMVGERPCSTTPRHKVIALRDAASAVIEKVTNRPVLFESASTDCNIPLSLGIPAICVGVNHHHGIHTREEWVEKASLAKGLEIAIDLARSAYNAPTDEEKA
ncbi:MAG: M20/M25/M40 family metallo-hydrolase [Clostridia bacterium]|nr:M20/M25/M40 family metallo-hydrolase [Clostridia bacterium]